VGSGEVRGRIVDPFSDSPVVSPPINVGRTGIRDRRPAIAVAPEHGFFVVCFATGRGPAGGSDGNVGIALQVVGADALPWGEPLQLVAGEANVGGLACGWNGTDVVVVWWRASRDAGFHTMFSERARPTFL
jgi:hypothetical protein